MSVIGVSIMPNLEERFKKYDQEIVRAMGSTEDDNQMAIRQWLIKISGMLQVNKELSENAKLFYLEILERFHAGKTGILDTLSRKEGEDKKIYLTFIRDNLRPTAEKSVQDIVKGLDAVNHLQQKSDKILKILMVQDQVNAAIKAANQRLDQYNQGRQSNRVGHVIVGQIFKDDLRYLLGERKEVEKWLNEQSPEKVSSIHKLAVAFDYEFVVNQAVEQNKAASLGVAQANVQSNTAKVKQDLHESLSKIAKPIGDWIQLQQESNVQTSELVYTILRNNALIISGASRGAGALKETAEQLHAYQMDKNESWKKPTVRERITGFFQKYILRDKQTSYEKRVERTQKVIDEFKEYDGLRDKLFEANNALIGDVNNLSGRLRDCLRRIDEWQRNLDLPNNKAVPSIGRFANDINDIVKEATEALGKYKSLLVEFEKSINTYKGFPSLERQLLEMKSSYVIHMGYLPNTLAQAQEVQKSLNETKHLESGNLLGKLQHHANEYQKLLDKEGSVAQKISLDNVRNIGPTGRGSH